MTQLITKVVSETPHDARAISGLSAAVGVSRATFYRHRQRVQPREPSQAERQARQAIQEVALEMPSYGYRPMTAELPHDDNLDFSPRVGFAFDITGSGRHLLRGSIT